MQKKGPARAHERICPSRTGDASSRTLRQSAMKRHSLAPSLEHSDVGSVQQTAIQFASRKLRYRPIRTFALLEPIPERGDMEPRE
jgi:hypothetical protein